MYRSPRHRVSTDGRKISDRRYSPGGTTVETAQERYLRSLDAGGSRDTLRWVLADGKQSFLAYLQNEGIEHVAAIDTDTIRNWGFALRERTTQDDLAASTAHNYYAYVRAFLKFCVRDGLLDSNPAKTEAAMEFLPEDTGDRDRQFWTDEARDAILQFVQRRVDEAYENDDIEGATAYRDRALVTLLALTGVRGAEVFRDPNDDLRNGLRWSDVNLDQGTIRVLGKSREYERVSLEDNCYLPSGERAADNAELVSKAVAVVENVGREARASGGPVDNSAQVVLIFFVRTATVIVRYVGFTFLPDLNFLHSGDHVHLGYGIRSRRRTDPAIQGVMAPGYWRVQSPIR